MKNQHGEEPWWRNDPWLGRHLFMENRNKNCTCCWIYQNMHVAWFPDGSGIRDADADGFRTPQADRSLRGRSVLVRLRVRRNGNPRDLSQSVHERTDYDCLQHPGGGTTSCAEADQSVHRELHPRFVLHPTL